jgi:hypothetical protein
MKRRDGNVPENMDESIVAEDLSKLVTIECDQRSLDLDIVLQCLSQDLVILIQNLDAAQADNVIFKVAERLGIADSLELQASFAGFQGHRHNIGKYYMSVNKRFDYQFVTPHSEGSSFIGMQLASFFCHENSTDGGETILMNIDGRGVGWCSVREKASRAKLGIRKLARHEIMQARGLHQLNLPEDILTDDDQVLAEHRSKIPGLTVVTVLAKPRKTYSRILDCDVNVYWDSVDSPDFDSVHEYERMLRQSALLREPPDGFELAQLDSSNQRRLWHSGIKYKQLFKSKITRKLTTGDLIILNNLTWTHAVANWSPNSGTRKIAAAFA